MRFRTVTLDGLGTVLYCAALFYAGKTVAEVGEVFKSPVFFPFKFPPVDLDITWLRVDKDFSVFTPGSDTTISAA